MNVEYRHSKTEPKSSITTVDHWNASNGWYDNAFQRFGLTANAAANVIDMASGVSNTHRIATSTENKCSVGLEASRSFQSNGIILRFAALPCWQSANKL